MADPPTTPALKTDFDASAAFLLTALANKFSIAASRRLRRRLDVGLMEWRVIALLGVEGEVPPARIAQVAGVDKSVVSRAVTGLERRGLLTVAAGPQPGRQTLLSLTGAGQAVHDRGMPGVLEAEAGLLHGFSGEERARVVDMLRRMTGNLILLGD